jgi:hypothetical protein
VNVLMVFTSCNNQGLVNSVRFRTVRNVMTTPVISVKRASISLLRRHVLSVFRTVLVAPLLITVGNVKMVTFLRKHLKPAPNSPLKEPISTFKSLVCRSVAQPAA